MSFSGATPRQPLVARSTRVTYFRGARASLITAAAITRYIVLRQAEKAAKGTINREVAVLFRMLRLGT